MQDVSRNQFSQNLYSTNKTIGKADGPTDWNNKRNNIQMPRTSQLCEGSVCCRADKSPIADLYCTYGFGELNEEAVGFIYRPVYKQH